MSSMTAEPHLRNPIRKTCKKYVRKVFNTKVIKRRLPIIEWFPKYSIGALIQDIVAGLTVGLTAIPQGIAYAVIAGLPPEYGLYSSLTAGAIYTFLGSCKDLSVGPTAILSAITAKYVSNYSADFAILAAFLSGVLIVLMAILRLGFLVEFISLPVVSGFTTAAALQISTSQLVPLIGLKARSGNYFADSVYSLVTKITTFNIWDAILGFLTILMLLLLKRFGEGCSLNVNRIKWLISIARNTIVVVIGMLIAYIARIYFGEDHLTLIGNINGGLPEFGLPPFQTVVNNETYLFVDMVDVLGFQSIVIPFISVLESVVLSKVFSEGQPDISQEIFALGICNIVGSFVKSIPITAAFSRSTLNHVSGAQTTLGGILTCILVALSLTLLTSSFAFIPKTCLAALIISAMYSMINISMVLRLWRTSKKEFSVLIITISVSLCFGLEFGIIAGVIAEACILIYKQARPDLDTSIVQYEGKSLCIIKLSHTVLYCAAEHIRKELFRVSLNNSDALIIIDGSYVKKIDFTVASRLLSCIKELEKSSRAIFFVNFDSSIVNVFTDIAPDCSGRFLNCKNYIDLSDELKI